MTNEKQLWYVEFIKYRTPLDLDLVEESLDSGLEVEINREFMVSQLERDIPKSKLKGKRLTHSQVVEIPTHRINLIKSVKDKLDLSPKSAKQVWYAEVRNRQIFNQRSTTPGGIRDFDYVIFMASTSESGARSTARRRLFRTSDEFFSAYYNENCPPPQMFDLECSITYFDKVRVPGYEIELHKYWSWSY